MSSSTFDTFSQIFWQSFCPDFSFQVQKFNIQSLSSFSRPANSVVGRINSLLLGGFVQFNRREQKYALVLVTSHKLKFLPKKYRSINYQKGKVFSHLDLLLFCFPVWYFTVHPKREHSQNV